MLALGARGLPLWRRKESVAETREDGDEERIRKTKKF
jgi:hypothetical protein